MGYEIKLYIGKVHDNWFQVYATIDLAKLGHREDILTDLVASSHRVANEIANINGKTYFFYADDGNTELREDCYGDHMSPVSVRKVYEAIIESNKLDPYKRLDWAQALLKSMLEDDLYVIFYGH